MLRFISLYFLFITIFFQPFKAFAGELKAQGSIFLDLKKNLIKGEFVFYLEPNTNYKIYSKGFKITQILLGKKSLISPLFSKEGNILVLTGTHSHTLKLKFEKKYNFWAFPVEILLPFFPYPINQPFTYSLKLYLPKKLPKYVLVPYQSFSLKHTRYYTVYIFKSSTPSSPPPLIIGDLIKKKLNIADLNLSFYCQKSQKKLCSSINSEELSTQLSKFKKFPKLFHNFFILIDDNLDPSISAPRFFVLPSDASYKKIFAALIENQLVYGIYWKNKIFGKALSFFLTSYLPSSEKTKLRKALLLQDNIFSKYAFILTIAMKDIPEEKIIKELNNFYQKFSFKKASFKDWFELFLGNSTLPEVNYLQKVSLNLHENFLISQGKNYLFDYTLSSSLLPYSPKVKVNIITSNNTISQVVSLDKKTFIEKRCLLGSPPKMVVVDPDYLVYRSLNPEEIDITFNNMLKKPGIIIVNKDEIFKYKNILSFLKRFNYSVISITPEDYYKLSSIFNSKQNIIYLGIIPKQMFFVTPPKEGLYFFVIPSPSDPSYFRAFIKLSFFESSDVVNIFKKNLNATELWIKNRKVIKKRVIKGTNGLHFSLSTIPSLIKVSALLSPDELARQLIATRLIVLNPPQNERQLTFLKNLLLSLKKFQNLAVLYQQDLGNSSVTELLNLANASGIHFQKISLPEDLIKKIRANGVKNLSQKELLKLPEVDFFNPAYEAYLKNFWNGTNSTDFQKFYQSQLVKAYCIVEKTFKYLSKHPHQQVFLFTKKEFFYKNLGIPQILKKKLFSNFKTLIFEKTEELRNISDFVIK